MRKHILLAAGLSILLLLFGLQSQEIQAAPRAQLTVFPTPTPGPDGRITYIAQEQDTVWRIAAISGIDLNKFRELNPQMINDIIIPGQAYLIGFAGPASGAPTAGPLPTQAIVTPSPTALPGWGILCVLLYNDLNGDAMRQETEPSIPDGEISVSNRLGTVSLTAQTPSGGVVSGVPEPTPQELGYSCFDQLAQGDYLISVAAPEGYNRTTSLNQTMELDAGQTTLLAFGAQMNSEMEAQTALIPESPRKSPLMGILGGVLLLAGVGLGIYAALLRRSSSPKTNKG